MLTAEQKQNNKLAYFNLLSRLNIDLTELSKFLDAIDYFEKPATAQSYGAFPGGLCNHALNVCNELGQLVNAYCPGKYTEEDIIKIALFKDIYKAVMYEKYNRNVKNEITQKWETKEEYRIKAEREVFGDLGFSSYMIAKRFVSLTDEQIEAICQSSLGMETNFKTYDLYNILAKYNLVVLTHMAEFAAAYLN